MGVNAMAIKQLSVFVENRQGRLAEITEILRQNDIDIRALSIADTTEFGILRLIVNHPSRAERALKEQDFTVSQTEVIAICIDDRPGGLADALKVLDAAQIQVEYVYAFLSRDDKTAYVILRVDDNGRAAEVLRGENVRLLEGSEIL